LKLAVHQWLESRKYFTCFFFSEERKAECCAEINAFRPRTVVGYAGKLVELACYARDHAGALTWRAENLVTAAEGLHPGQRELLERHLGEKVFLSYGSREFMLIGIECERHQGYHLSDDNLYVEVVDEQGAPLPPGETGRIVVTDLHNAANPFVRYEIGDLGAMAPETETCPCGKPFRRLLRVDGRLQESVLTPDGARLTALYFPHALKEFAWIDAYQIRQRNREGIELCLVTAAPLVEAQVNSVREMLQTKLGAACRIEVKRVEKLETRANGKTPIVVSV
jgi:phenylacetate-CoA ligase